MASPHINILLTKKSSIDAMSLMGPRAYTQQCSLINQYRDSTKIFEKYEIQSKMEFVQYLNSLDDRPAYLGGRNNQWRELSLENLPNAPVQFALPVKKSGAHVTPQKIKKKLKPKIQEKNILQEINLEDDFGMLFEWTHDLSVDHLEDYTVQ